MKLKKISCLLLTVMISAGIISGCTAKKNEGSTPAAGNKEQESKVVYPIKTDKTLTFWCQLSAGALPYGNNLADTPLGKELEKQTGVKVKYIHPAQGAALDQFNIMVASGDIPDMIEWDWTKYPGGTVGAAKNGLIIPLNDILPKYAPSLMKYLNEDKELNKMVKTDDGKYYVYPHIRNDIGAVWCGPILRNDWLSELGLQVPETIDEWYATLKAFKKKGIDSPLSFSYDNNAGPNLANAFLGAYKISFGNFIDENGKVQYGPMTSQYKEFLTTFNKWYSEGLIDKDFAMADGKAQVALVDNYKTGAWIGNVGGSIKTELDKFKTKDTKFDLAGAKYPVLKKGDKAFIGQSDFKYYNAFDCVITTKCKDPELAAQWLDFAYSEKGNLVYNFGVENESYTLTNGNPQFIKEVQTNPTKGLAGYIKYNGAFRDDERYTQQNMIYTQMPAAVKNWQQTDALKHNIPPVSYTPDESKELAKISTDLRTYVNAMFVKFVMGVEPISGFDKYLEQLNKLGVDRMNQITQAALDRYNKR